MTADHAGGHCEQHSSEKSHRQRVQRSRTEPDTQFGQQHARRIDDRQQQRERGPDEAEMQHREQPERTAAHALQQTPAHREPGQRDRGRADEGQCQPCSLRRSEQISASAKLDRPEHQDSRQQYREHPVRSPRHDVGHDVGSEKRQHPVRDGRVDRRSEAEHHDPGRGGDQAVVMNRESGREQQRGRNADGPEGHHAASVQTVPGLARPDQSGERNAGRGPCDREQQGAEGRQAGAGFGADRQQDNATDMQRYWPAQRARVRRRDIEPARPCGEHEANHEEWHEPRREGEPVNQRRG